MLARSGRWALTWGLVVLGVGALGAHGGEFTQLDGWAWVAIAAFVAAPFVGMPSWPSLRWVVGAFPFWVFGGAGDGMVAVAVALTMVGLIRLAVGPTLVARRRSSKQDARPVLPAGSGPLIQVAARVYPAARPSRGLRWVAIGLACVGLALFVVAGTRGDEGAAVAGGLALAAWIVGGTFFFGNWFAGRVRLRVDKEGVHGRVLWTELSAPWNDITELALRYLFLGSGGRLVYYVVRTPTCEVAFPSSMADASELQRTIELATGQTFPVPEITPNM